MNRMDTALSEYLFHQGTNYHAYDYLGCHAAEADGTFRYTFRTWAPNAAAVAVVGDFTDAWQGELPLARVSDKGVWAGELVSRVSLAGQKYKFRITAADGAVRLKGDPYAFFSEGGSGGASIICHESDFIFSDGEWLERRSRYARGGEDDLPLPLNIYEMHAASFARHADGRYLSYRELADTLVPYLKYMGYTHVEFMPLCEYPYDGSWGYQICAYYAPTCRFGSPDDFRYLVDRLHTAGIGVLMDWVPAHFPKDEWGLYEFDGRPLYEYQGADRMESRGWGTRFFDVGREEVQSFLVSNALYWLREFHLDGLRVDAVAAMLYRDYDREGGEWFPNSQGGRENLEAIAFFRKLNSAVCEEFPDALMIAEESTAFPGVTAPVSEGGLGFRLKWNMGFASDFFEYLAKDPLYRRYHHRALTFPMMYAYSERFILPISHDEVVYGKGSLYRKCSGGHRERMDTMRAALTLMMTFPGKKMLFMGTEFGQENEWYYETGIDLHLLEREDHRSLRDFTAALNRFYLTHPALWEQDFTPAGFAWIDVDRADDNMISYRRRASGGEELIVVVSFNGCDLTDYRLAVPSAGNYDVLFFSGDWGDHYEKSFEAVADEQGIALHMRLPARTAVVLGRHASGVSLTIVP